MWPVESELMFDSVRDWSFPVVTLTQPKGWSAPVVTSTIAAPPVVMCGCLYVFALGKQLIISHCVRPHESMHAHVQSRCNMCGSKDRRQHTQLPSQTAHTLPRPQSSLLHAHGLDAEVELVAGQRLGQDVGDHRVGGCVAEGHFLAQHALASKVVDDVDVLAPE